jgi:hypothetical protein
MEELHSLIRKAISQLEEFNSDVKETMERICWIVSGDAAIKKALAPIERHVSGYNYEQGLAELTVLAKSMSILGAD